MKKFIAFMVIALPLTAILSMVAGFWYAGATRPSQRASVASQSLTGATLAPVQNDLSAGVYALQMQGAIRPCAEGSERFTLAQSLSDYERALQLFDDCAAGIRDITPPTGMDGVHADALRLAGEVDAFTGNIRAGIRNSDMARINQSIENVRAMSRLIDAITSRLNAIAKK